MSVGNQDLSSLPDCSIARSPATILAPPAPTDQGETDHGRPRRAPAQTRYLRRFRRLRPPRPAARVVGIVPTSPPAKIAGRVVTMKLVNADGRTTTRHLGTGAIEAANPGDVIVVEHGAHRRCRLGRHPQRRGQDQGHRRRHRRRRRARHRRVARARVPGVRPARRAADGARPHRRGVVPASR